MEPESGSETDVANVVMGFVCDDASIKPAQVPIEGLAQLCNGCKAQQAGSVNFVLTTYCLFDCSSEHLAKRVSQHSETLELLPFVNVFDTKN
jgi:hypothetical protein